MLRFCLLVGLGLMMCSCALVALPFRLAGKVVETGVDVTGAVVKAPFELLDKDEDEEALERREQELEQRERELQQREQQQREQQLRGDGALPAQGGLSAEDGRVGGGLGSGLGGVEGEGEGAGAGLMGADGPITGGRFGAGQGGLMDPVQDSRLNADL